MVRGTAVPVCKKKHLVPVDSHAFEPLKWAPSWEVMARRTNRQRLPAIRPRYKLIAVPADCYYFLRLAISNNCGNGRVQYF
jgi:hypothetical protein